MPAQALIDRYRDQVLKLLPPGAALSRRLDSYLAEWAEAIGVEFARIHDRVLDLYAESYPGTASELLADWEELCGLPNSCTYLLTSDADRQAAVLRKFAVTEGQSASDFQSIASSLGYALDISTYETSRCGVMRCGHTPLHSDPWLFASRMSYENGMVATSDNQGLWNYDSSTATAPGSTFVRFDSTDETLIAKCRIHDTRIGSDDMGSMFDGLADGSFVVFTHAVDESQWVKFKLDGVPVDQSGWHTLNVVTASTTASAGFTFPADNADLRLYTNVAEVASALDTVLECTLREHAHAYTQINFNPWDISSALALLSNNMTSHFVHGEFVTHSAGSLDIIDSWTNRGPSDDWEPSSPTPDGSTMYASRRGDGWMGADADDVFTTRSLVGLSADTTVDSGTFIEHGNFTMFLVFFCHSYDGATRDLLVSGDLSIVLETSGSENRIAVTYDGATARPDLAVGAVNVLTIASDGNEVFAVNNRGLQSDPLVNGGPYTDGETLVLGGQVDCSIIEMIALDGFEGNPVLSGGTIAVRNYLLDKYGV